MDSAPETWSPMDPRALEQLVQSMASRLQAVEASKQQADRDTTDAQLVQVEQRLSAQLQALASKQQADQSTLAHTTTRALDAACSQWRQWREDSQATGVTRDEVDALERRLRGQVDQMRAEWDDERSQLRTALVTAKAEVSELRDQSAQTARTMAQLALRTTERQGVPASPPVSPGGAAVVGGGDLQGCWTQRLEKVEDELNRWRGAARSAEALAKAAAVETAAAWDGYRREAEEQRAQWQAEQEAAVVALTRQLSDATRTVAALQQQHSASLDEAERARVEHRFQLTERMQSLVADVRRQHEHAGADVGKALQGMAEVVRQAQQAQATARTKLQQLEDSHAKLAQRMTVERETAATRAEAVAAALRVAHSTSAATATELASVAQRTATQLTELGARQAAAEAAAADAADAVAALRAADRATAEPPLRSLQAKAAATEATVEALRARVAAAAAAAAEARSAAADAAADAAAAAAGVDTMSAVVAEAERRWCERADGLAAAARVAALEEKVHVVAAAGAETLRQLHARILQESSPQDGGITLAELHAAVQGQQIESSRTLRMLVALQESTSEKLSAQREADAAGGDVDELKCMVRALRTNVEEERRHRTQQQQQVASGYATTEEISAWKDDVEQRAARLSKQLHELASNSVCANSLAAVKADLCEQLRLERARSADAHAAMQERMTSYTLTVDEMQNSLQRLLAQTPRQTTLVTGPVMSPGTQGQGVSVSAASAAAAEETGAVAAVRERMTELEQRVERLHSALQTQRQTHELRAEAAQKAAAASSPLSAVASSPGASRALQASTEVVQQEAMRRELHEAHRTLLELHEAHRAEVTRTMHERDLERAAEISRHMDAMHAVIEQTKQHLTAAVERYPHTTEEVRSALDAMASQQRAFQVAVTKAAQEDAAALRERAALEVSQVALDVKRVELAVHNAHAQTADALRSEMTELSEGMAAATAATSERLDEMHRTVVTQLESFLSDSVERERVDAERTAESRASLDSLSGLVANARDAIVQQQQALGLLEGAQQGNSAEIDNLRNSVVFAGDLVKLWKPLNKMTSDIDSTRAESRADAAQLKQRLSVLADSHAADTQALATSIAELGASLQDMHKTACQEWRAPYAELHGALDGVRSELDRVRGELEGMRGHLEALKASTAGADQLSDVLQTTALLTESVESLTGDTAAAATELQKVAAEVRRVAAEVCDLQGVTGDEQRQLVSRLAELQQQLTAEQETREINRAYVCGRVDEESHRRCELEMQVASLHTEKANFEVVRNLQDEYRKLVLVIDGVQVMVEEHRSYLSAHIGEVTTQLAQQQQASRVELNATIDSHRVLLQTLEEEQACYRGQLVTQLQLYKEEAARVAQELTRLEEESKASTTQLEEKLRTAEVASTSALEQLGANAQQTKSRLELRLDEVESQHMEHVAATSAEFLQVGQKVARLNEQVEANAADAAHKADFDDVVEVLRDLKAELQTKADNATMHEATKVFEQMVATKADERHLHKLAKVMELKADAAQLQQLTETMSQLGAAKASREQMLELRTNLNDALVALDARTVLQLNEADARLNTHQSSLEETRDQLTAFQEVLSGYQVETNNELSLKANEAEMLAQIAHLKETCAKMVDKLFLETCSLIANEKAEAEASLKNAQAHLQGQVDGNGQHIARLEQRSEHLDEVVVQLSATASSKDELSEAQQLLEQKTDAVSTVLYHELQTVQLQLEQAVKEASVVSSTALLEARQQLEQKLEDASAAGKSALEEATKATQEELAKRPMDTHLNAELSGLESKVAAELSEKVTTHQLQEVMRVFGGKVQEISQEVAVRHAEAGAKTSEVAGLLQQKLVDLDTQMSALRGKVEPVLKMVGRSEGDVSKMTEKLATISVKVEELWSQKMYQSRDSNAKAVATTEAKRLMAALEAKVSLMDERVVTNTTNTTHVASMLEIKMADVANQMEWSKQVAKEAEETLARQTLQIGDINSQILRLGMDNATKADISNVRSEVANMKGHFSELREHVMDAGLGKADEEEVRAGFIKLQVAMEERAGQETSINSKLAELRHLVEELQAEATCGVRTEQVAQLDDTVAAVRTQLMEYVQSSGLKTNNELAALRQLVEGSAATLHAELLDGVRKHADAVDAMLRELANARDHLAQTAVHHDRQMRAMSEHCSHRMAELEELNRRLTVVVEPKQHELANQIGALRLEHDTVRDVTNQLNQRMERTLQKAELDAALSKIQRIEQQLLSTTFALRNTPERPLLEARNGLRS